MRKVLLAGAGKIGCLVASLLQDCGDYEVVIVDKHAPMTSQALLSEVTGLPVIEADLCDQAAAEALIREKKVEAIISCLPYFLNSHVAELAAQFNLHYFDLTEDTSVTARIKSLAKTASSAFVPQCGLAPGFIGIVGNSLMQQFDEINAVKLRVGALPQNASNALSYAITWSTDGLINQYANPCQGIIDQQFSTLAPLAGLESIQLDGLAYEAFNTSGGLGSLAELWQGRVSEMTYKTLRYPGHCEKMRFLMQGLKLNQDRDTLKSILEQAIPYTDQDVVLIYVAVSGQRNGKYCEHDFVKKVYPNTLFGKRWSAIQITTASGCCAIFDMVMQRPASSGFIYQENFSLETFLKNRFAACYR